MANKKIGILTFHNADNYGALLQAYALKYCLKQQGNKADIINYYCPKIQNDYKLFFPFSFSKKWLKTKLKRFLFFPVMLYIRSKFRPFRKQYLLDTEPLYPDTVASMADNYDIFISGSDQVFNTRITDFDTNYFLAFSKNKNKNFSYAASFGLQWSHLTDKEKLFFKEQFDNFAEFSVREQQGADIIRYISGRDCQINLDPALLLTKDKWAQIAAPVKQQGYVLLYLMYKDSALIRFAKKLAKAKGLKVLFISLLADFKNRVPAQHITPTPQQWLGLFLNADYVVTNSFHGFAFSVNLNKTFFLGRLPEKLPVNSRLDNLLALTGLEGRLYTNFKNDSDYDIPTDWQSVNEKLDKERQKALDYLKDITK